MAGGGGAVLGVSGEYHDAAAALVLDGRIVAAAQEERFSRVKHDPSMPRNAMRWCLEHGDVAAGELDAVVFYDKPLTTYERILSTHARVGPRGYRSLAQAVSTWSRRKLWTGQRLESVLAELGQPQVRTTYCEHHMSHAASAYYPSPFDSAAVLTFDGVGEWATSSIAVGRGAQLSMLSELRFPDSLGLFYSAMTSFCGFEVNEGEYKLMGLAPYGEPRFVAALRDRVVEVAEDGSLRLDQRYFAYRAGASMTSRALEDLLGGPPLALGEAPGQRQADIARSAQVVLEEVVLRMARHAYELTGERRACLAGGVALNCVANQRLLADGPFDDVWVQPAAGDAGGSLGAALWWWYQIHGGARSTSPGDSMEGAFLGPAYDDGEIVAWLRGSGVEHDVLEDGELFPMVAAEIAAGAVVGWLRGRSEFGPRALGHRSILADPRDSTMVRRLNLKIKGRESFRPFAPAILAEHAATWFDPSHESPYMLFTTSLHPSRRVDHDVPKDRPLAERLEAVRSELPACTHVDGSARFQTVDASRNADFHRLLVEFHARTGCPALINTSFNRGGEPIVETPADALRCFAGTEMDLLVLENSVVRRPALVGLPELSVDASAGTAARRRDTRRDVVA